MGEEVRGFVLDVLLLSWLWAILGRLAGSLALEVRSQRLGGDCSVSSTPSDSWGGGSGGDGRGGSQGEGVGIDSTLKNIGLRGGRQPRRAGGGGQHRVREGRASGTSGRKGWQLALMLLRHPLRRIGKRSVLGECCSRGAHGPKVSGPGFTWRFLLLGRGMETGGVREIRITDETEWDPGEPVGGGEMEVRVEEGLSPFPEGKREE